VNLAGAEVPNMDPETTLLVLCMHGSKHVWSRLIWICDVARLLTEFPGLDWRRVTREARRLGLWRSLALGVLLAHRVCLAEVPPAIMRRFQSDASARGLAQHFEQNLLDEPGRMPESRVPYNVRLLGFHDRLRLFLSPEFFRPNARDLAFVHLPKSLHVLYFLVRPLRIIRDKSAR
jgi:putative nucleotidyltransferase-like protein